MPRNKFVDKNWMLNKAKTKHLELVEALNMWLLGYFDGKVGLPQQAGSGGWTSPRLKKEWDAYSEFCDRAWGTAQLQLTKDYENISILIAEIQRRNELLKKWKEEPPPTPDDSSYLLRKGGEEDLPEDLVIARRQREYLAINAPYHAKIKQLENEIDLAHTQLEMLQAHCVEINNSTRLGCQRIEYHTNQRRDAYWNAAWRVHPEKAQMPLTPEPLLESEAELTYTAAHKSLLDEVVDMLARRKRLSLATDDNVKTFKIKGVA